MVCVKNPPEGVQGKFPVLGEYAKDIGLVSFARASDENMCALCGLHSFDFSSKLSTGQRQLGIICG